MTIKTSSVHDIQPFIKKLVIPEKNSHKGQNGKLLVIGGSHLFHAASLWSAEIASHFVDMVHFASTDENNEIMLSLKKIFRNGMVVSRSDIESYIGEDDAILLGPGFDRSDETSKITEEVIKKHPEKKFVIDAGSLQMMNPDLLRGLPHGPIITPHIKEYERLFHCSITNLSEEEKVKDVQKRAYLYKCVIMLKTIVDIISDGNENYVVVGGNPGLTKGGTGDILAGLTAALYTKNDSLTSCVLASYILKKTADELSSSKGYWYNNNDIINAIPITVKKLFI